MITIPHVIDMLLVFALVIAGGACVVNGTATFKGSLLVGAGYAFWLFACVVLKEGFVHALTVNDALLCFGAAVVVGMVVFVRWRMARDEDEEVVAD